MDIIEFAEIHKYPLYPVQRVLLKLCYRLPLTDDLIEVRTDWNTDVCEVFTEAQYVDRLRQQGRYREGSGGAVRAFSLGRRSGKDHLIQLLLAYETSKLAGKRISESPRPSHRREDVIGVLAVVLAVDLTRDHGMGMLRGLANLAEKSPIIGEYLANENQSFLSFQTAEDIEDTGTWKGSQRQARASIRVSVRSPMAKGLRGAHRTFVVLNEMSHYPKSSVAEVWGQVRPSSGILLAISSPSAGNTFFRQVYEDPESLSVRIPTWEMNPTLSASLLIQQHEKLGPAMFQQEYGASFTDEIEVELEGDLYAWLEERAEARGISVSRLIYDCLAEVLKREKV